MLSVITDMPIIFSRLKSTYIKHVYSKLKYNEDSSSPILKNRFFACMMLLCFLITKQTFSYKSQVDYFKGTAFSVSLMETCDSLF